MTIQSIQLLGTMLVVLGFGTLWVVMIRGRKPVPVAHDVSVRRRFECPVEGRSATADFEVGPYDGEVYLDVAHCSLAPAGGRPDCGRVCRSASVAPFAARVAPLG